MLSFVISDIMSTGNSVCYGHLIVLYGKAEYYPDCSPLFIDKKITRASIFSMSDELIEVVEETIGIIRKRLDIMGYTLDYCKKHYLESERYGDFIDFDTFLQMIRFVNADLDPTKSVVEGLELVNFSYWERMVWEYNTKNHTNYDLDFDDDFFLHLDQLVKLRLFCEGHDDSKILYWDIFGTIEAEYYTEDEIFHEIDPKYKITVITEGTTDMGIIESAFSNYYPEYRYFFEFIDYEKISVFGGADKSKVLFEAFVKLQIMNRILFLFDNDATGVESYESIRMMKHQDNLMAMLLPDLDCLKKVTVIGPEGNAIHDVNGYANSIECFLDFSFIDQDVSFRWISYKNKVERYQGEIVEKTKLQKTIKKIGSKSYNHEKLDILVNSIIEHVCK